MQKADETLKKDQNPNGTKTKIEKRSRNESTFIFVENLARKNM